jgi:hypothetical protein
MFQQWYHGSFETKCSLGALVSGQQFAIANFSAEGKLYDAPDVWTLRCFKGARAPKMARCEEVLAIFDGETPQVAARGQPVRLIQVLNKGGPPTIYWRFFKEFSHPEVEWQPGSCQRFIPGQIVWGSAQALAHMGL